MATTTLDDRPAIAPPVRSLLGGLRRRIRQYVWLEGCAAAVAWLGVAFWATLAADWLFEPAPAVRGFMLLAVAAVLAAVLVRWIGRRAFVPITDGNAAMLLERRFPQLGDTLLTAVLLGDGGEAASRLAAAGTAAPKQLVADVPSAAKQAPDDLSLQMLARTCREAAIRTSRVEPREVFNPRPLWLHCGAASVLLASVVFFAVLESEAFATWARRALGAFQPTLAAENAFRPGGRVHQQHAEGRPRLGPRSRGPGRHRPRPVRARGGRGPLSDGRRAGPGDDGPPRHRPRARQPLPGIRLRLPQHPGRHPLRHRRRRRPHFGPLDSGGR